MTRRAKEKRLERAQEKARVAERLEKEAALALRPEWKQLLGSLDGSSGDSKTRRLSTAIVETLHWKSTSAPIAAADCFQLSIKVDASQAIMTYEFSTREYDITFAIQMICADGTMVELMEPKRFESQKQATQGRLDLRGPGMVLLIWDNSYSWLNPKQLAYSIELKQQTPAKVDQQASRTQRAMLLKQERTQALVQEEKTLGNLEKTIEDEDTKAKELHLQIAALQEQIRQSEALKAAAIKQQLETEERIDMLQYEIRELNWRCLDVNKLETIYHFLDLPSIAQVALVNKKWAQTTREIMPKLISTAASASAASTEKETVRERVNSGELHREVDPLTSSQAA